MNKVTPIRKEKEMTTEQLVELACFEAAIDEKQLPDFEQSAQNAQVHRRMCLIILTKDARAVREMRIKDPVMYAEMTGLMHDLEHHAEAVREFARSAWMRLEITDCWVEAGGGVDSLEGDEEG